MQIYERGISVQYYDKKVVGMRIKELRKKQNMTQSKLSECLDYTTERQLQRIENGETACSIDKLMEIAQILNTSTDMLLFGNEKFTAQNIITILDGKDSKQVTYLNKLLQVAADNLFLLE